MRNILFKSFLVLSLPFITLNASAESVYLGAYTSYGKVENEGRTSDSSAIKAVVGVQIHPQWNIELSYADFGKVDAVEDQANNIFKSGFDATGIGFSLLGVARAQTGMLYYKVGTTKLDGTQQVYGQTSCAGTDSVIGETSKCERELDDNALTFGLGWEQTLTRSWSLRAEYERISADGELVIENAFVGVTYRF